MCDTLERPLFNVEALLLLLQHAVNIHRASLRQQTQGMLRAVVSEPAVPCAVFDMSVTRSQHRAGVEPAGATLGSPGPGASQSLSPPGVGARSCMASVALQLLEQLWGFLPVPSSVAHTGVGWPWGGHQAGTSHVQGQEDVSFLPQGQRFCVVSCFSGLCFLLNSSGYL